MNTGVLIAVKLYDNFQKPVDGYDIESLGKTSGRGMSFTINGRRHYALTDGSDVRDPSGWWILGGDVFRRVYTDEVENGQMDVIELGIRHDRLYIMLVPSEGGDHETFKLGNNITFTGSVNHLYDVLHDNILKDVDVEYKLASILVDDNLMQHQLGRADSCYDQFTATCSHTSGDRYINPIYADQRDLAWSQPSCDRHIPPTYSEQKEQKNMMNLNLSNTLLKNIRCGKAGAGFGISLFDGAITYKGHSFNGKTLVETAGFELDAGDFLFIMPTNTIKKGDIVALQNDAAYYDGESFISLTTGMKSEYVPISCFGMTFYSVVRNMLGNLTGVNGSNGGNNMANLLPLMLLDKDGDSDSLMKMMLLMNGGLNFNFANPNADKSDK